MLARRVTRAATLRSQLQRRFIPSSTSTTSGSPLQARPNTWLAKIRFREDGKPRSRLIALGFGEQLPLLNFFIKLIDTLYIYIYYSEGSLILLSVFSSLTLNRAKEDDENIQQAMVKMIYVQQADIAYDSVNFDDPKSTLSYFIKLCLSISSSSEEKTGRLFYDLMTRIYKTKNKEIEAQYIMRRAAERIHGAIQELKRDSIVTTSKFVLNVMQDAMKFLEVLSYAVVDDDDDDSPESTSFIRDHTKKDAGD
jgi:hypothetical protein